MDSVFIRPIGRHHQGSRRTPPFFSVDPYFVGLLLSSFGMELVGDERYMDTTVMGRNCNSSLRGLSFDRNPSELERILSSLRLSERAPSNTNKELDQNGYISGRLTLPNSSGWTRASRWTIRPSQRTVHVFITRLPGRKLITLVSCNCTFFLHSFLNRSPTSPVSGP